MAEDGIDQVVAYSCMFDVPVAYALSGDRFLEMKMETGVQREIVMDSFS